MKSALKYKPAKKPTTHQKVAVAGMIKGTSLNFDDQGLGKTKQAYDAAGIMLARGEVSLCIFITKAALIHNMCNEIETDATQLSPVIISGNRQKRLSTYKYLTANCIVMSYETLVNDMDIIETLIQENHTALFFDESHYLKNGKAKRTEVALKISNHAKRKICFSGTPAPNGHEDMFTQLKITGHDVGSNIKDFRRRFSTVEDVATHLEGKFVRRRKEAVQELNIPNKKVVKLRCKLNPLQKQIYAAVLSDTLKHLESLRLKQTILPIKNILVQMMRLNQAASNPRLIVDGYEESPAKFMVLQSLVKEILDRGEKVVIWTSFKKNIHSIKKLFPGESVLELSGDLNGKKKFDTASKFQKDPNAKILVGVPAAAREGFTLTSANHAIFLDRSFSNLDWLQAQDRIHRITQKKECHIYALIASSTIDEQIDMILDQKEQRQIRLLSDSHQPDVTTVDFLTGLIESLRQQV